MASSNTDCSSFTTGASSGAEAGAERAEVDRASSPMSCSSSLREAGDLARCAGRRWSMRVQHLALGDHRRLHVLLQDARQLVEGEQIGRVGHADQHGGAAVFQHERAEAARRGLGQLAHQARLKL